MSSGLHGCNLRLISQIFTSVLQDEMVPGTQDRHALLDNEGESGSSYFFRDFGQSTGSVIDPEAPDTGDPWVLWDKGISGQHGIIWLRTQTLKLAGRGLSSQFYDCVV